MKKIKSIQIKAALSLVVFLLNTIIGFACAVGLDMGFNSHHHQSSALVVSENHHHDKSHHHDDTDVQHKTNNDKDNCCNNEVMKFQKVDKALTSSINIADPVFFATFLASFYNLDILSLLSEKISEKE